MGERLGQLSAGKWALIPAPAPSEQKKAPGRSAGISGGFSGNCENEAASPSYKMLRAGPRKAERIQDSCGIPL